jgi:hypothetical protein
MRKIALFFLAFLVHLIGRGQKKILSYQNEERYPPPRSSVILVETNNAFIYTQSEKTGIVRLLWKNGDTVQLLQQGSASFSNKGFRTYSIIDDNIIKTYWKDQVISGMYKDRRILELIRDKKTADFYFSNTDLRSGSTRFTDTIRSSFSERVIYCFSKLDRLYLLTTRDKSDQLTIYTKEMVGEVKTKTDTITLAQLGITATDATTDANHFSDLFRKNEFAQYGVDQRYPAVATSFGTKAYCISDKFALTLNTQSGVSTLLLDLEDLTYSIRKFSAGSDNNREIMLSKPASCIFGDKLVSCGLNGEALLVNIFEFSSGNKLKSIKIDKTNVDDYAARPVQKTGSFLSKSDVKDEIFKSFISTVKTNSLSISCYEEGENIYISFAAPYKQIVNGSTLLNLALTAAGTYGINSMPNYWGFLVSGERGAQMVTYVGFDMSLNSSTFLSTRQTANFSVWDELTGFVSTHTNELRERLFFYMGGSYYLSDYLPETKTYCIYSFNEKGID